MEQVSIEEKTFDNNDYTSIPLQKGEYEGCSFINCDFSNADLTEIKFQDAHL